jgi:Outer membrane protein beta-barrel domain
VRTPFAALIAVAALLAACDARAQAPFTGRELRFALHLGLTGGGDKLATANFDDGSTSSIRAGGLVQSGAGLLWQPAAGPVAVQATFNYHVDDVSAFNGSLRFSRYPLEVLGYYTGLPRWRFGAGPRFVFSPRLKVDVPGDNSKITFDDTVGAVAEAGYQFGNYMWLNLRLTGEKYKVKAIDGTTVSADSDISGNSVGVNIVLYF